MYGKYKCKDGMDGKDLKFEIKDVIHNGKKLAEVKIGPDGSGAIFAFHLDSEDSHILGHLLRSAAKYLAKENKEPYEPPKTELDIYS